MVHVDFREKIIHKYDTIIKNREISERLENAIYNWCLKEIEKRGMTIYDLFYKIYMNKNIHIFTNIDLNKFKVTTNKPISTIQNNNKITP